MWMSVTVSHVRMGVTASIKGVDLLVNVKMAGQDPFVQMVSLFVLESWKIGWGAIRHIICRWCQVHYGQCFKCMQYCTPLMKTVGILAVIKALEETKFFHI